MINYRSAALTLAACAAGLSVTACTAGITTASSPATSAPPTGATGPSRSASVPAAASHSASAGRMIRIGGPLGHFPVPAGAKVGGTVDDNQAISVIFGSVTPAQVSSFYATALPRAGYTISVNSVVTNDGDTMAIIAFTGHGYKGNIDTSSNLAGTGVSVPGLGTKNLTTISLTPK